MDAFFCQKCRRVLFVSTALEPPTHPDKVDPAVRAKACTSYWITTPPAWMHEAITRPASQQLHARGGHDADGGTTTTDAHDDTEESEAGPNDGKLMCPDCGTRFGSFCWSGSTCSCGMWVVPAIQVHKSRVDRRAVPRGALTAAPTAPAAPKPS